MISERIICFVLLLLCGVKCFPNEFDEAMFDDTPPKIRSKYALWFANNSYIEQAEYVLGKEKNIDQKLFMHAVLNVMKGDLEAAMNFVERSLEEGIDITMYQAGPKHLLEPLYDYPPFQDLLDENDLSGLVHGPMLGDVTTNSFRVWIRTSKSMSARVLVANRKGKAIRYSDSITTFAINDFTAVMIVKRLKPDTKYFYTLKLDGEVVAEASNLPIKTAPLDARTAFSVVLAGCSNYDSEHEDMFEVMADARPRPRAFLWTGDNTYFNIPNNLVYQQYMYYRRWSRPEFRKLTRQVPVYAIYDDHDFGGNDCRGGTDPLEPSWKHDIVLSLFKQNYNNPQYGGSRKDGAAGLGVYHEFSIGGVSFFMMDGRYHRSAPGYANSTMLGHVQKQYLKQWLLDSSNFIFKVIVSPVPIVSGTKSGISLITGTYVRKQDASLDTWDGYETERQELFDFIRDHDVEGVILVSGDRHRMDFWRIPRQDHYDLFEISGAHLTKNSSEDAVEDAIFSLVGGPKFGHMEFRSRNVLQRER